MTRPDRRLRIVHRSCDIENGKPRPPYYSKLLALGSLMRAVHALPEMPEMLFLNDGPIEPDQLRVMERFGEVRPIRRGGSASRTYREMISVAAAMPGADESLVWFAEDDYLYLEDGFVRLLEGADAHPAGDYFMLYGGKSLDVAGSSTRSRQMVVLPAGGAEHPEAVATDVAGVSWFRLASTTSTFGVRGRVLREDAAILRFGALTGGSWDEASCRMVQGFRPHRPKVLRNDLLPFGMKPVAGWPKSIARGLVRAAAVPLSVRKEARRRVLLGTDPEHAFHMEEHARPPHPITARTAAVDWPSVASDSAEWARDHGIPVELPAAH